MMGNRLVDSSTGNRDGIITTEFSVVAGVIGRLFSMLRNYRWKEYGWIEVGRDPGFLLRHGNRIGKGFIIYEKFMDIYLKSVMLS